MPIAPLILFGLVLFACPLLIVKYAWADRKKQACTFSFYLSDLFVAVLSLMPTLAWATYVVRMSNDWSSLWVFIGCLMYSQSAGLAFGIIILLDPKEVKLSWWERALHLLGYSWIGILFEFLLALFLCVICVIVANFLP